MATISLITEKEKKGERGEAKATWRIPDWLLLEYKHWAIDERTSVNNLAIDALIAYYNNKRKVPKEKHFQRVGNIRNE